jgi:indolepyruvate ferredoxin oxidoreductase alpha subunit
MERDERASGEEALARTLKNCGVALVTGVYGDPCTTVLDRLAAEGLRVEISVEEKTALAQALGASVAGSRAVVAVKHVGVNVASDPLLHATTHGIGAGLLVLAGDDPGAAKSTTEQDSRWYAKLGEFPVLTPRDANILARAAVEGLALSEELGIPVMLQITARLMQARSGGDRITTGASQLGAPPTFDRPRAWGRFILDRHKYVHQRVWPRLVERVERSELHAVQRGDGPDGVISCGFVSSLVAHGNHFALGYAHPLPDRKLLEFLKGVRRVLIVEETAPIVEEGVRALVGAHGLSVEVIGRLTGHLPRVGPLEARHIEQAFEIDPHGLHFDVQIEVGDAILKLPCGGFEPLYQALDALLPEGHRVAGDVGCSILHGYFPPQVIDTAYGLGTSIATASGMSLAGHKGVAVIGDVGFLHSGITGLLNAVEHGHDVLVIILYNRISAMTPGRLEIRGLEKIQALAAACGPATIDEIDVDAATPEELKGLLRARLGESGVNVVIAKARPRPPALGA